MKRHFIKTAVAGALSALLLCTCLTPALAAWPDEYYDEAANVLENGDFDYDFEAWEAEGDYTLESGRDDGPCVRLEGTAGTALRQTLPLSPEDSGEYELRGYFFQENFSDISYIRITNDESTSEFQIMVAEGGWRRAGCSIPIDVSSETIIEIVPAEESGGYLMVDSLALVPKEELPQPPELDLSENFIANSDFENGVDGWGQFFNDVKIAQSTGGHESRYCMEISGATKGNSYAAYVETPYVPAGEYEVTAWFRLTGSASAVHMGALFGRGICAVALPAWNDEEWHKVSWYVECDESGELMYLLGCPGPGVTLYLDDLTITPVNYDNWEPEPNPDPDPDPEPSAKNLLQNPGFESGFSPWVQQGAPNAFVTDAVAKTGTNGLYFGYFASEGMVNYVEQTLPAEAGTYEGSVYIKTDATLTGVGAVLMLEARDISGKVLASAASPAVSSSGGWQETRAALKAPAGTAQLVVKLGGIYCTGAFYMDDVSLIKSE